MATDRRQQDLLGLLEMLRDAELIELAQATAHLDRAQSEITEVEQVSAARERAIADLQAPDPAMRSGADGRWQCRLEQDRKRLEDAEQEAIAAAAHQRQIAAVAVGRVQAFERVIARRQGRR